MEDKSEKEIEKEIFTLLYQIGIFCWKHDSVGIWDPKKKIFRSNNNPNRMKGISDICGIIPYYSDDKPLARALFIEVKSKTGTLSPEQRVFLARVLELGAIAFVARSTEDVIKNLIKHLPEHNRIKQVAQDFKVQLEH